MTKGTKIALIALAGIGTAAAVYYLMRKSSTTAASTAPKIAPIAPISPALQAKVQEHYASVIQKDGSYTPSTKPNSVIDYINKNKLFA